MSCLSFVTATTACCSRNWERIWRRQIMLRQAPHGSRMCCILPTGKPARLRAICGNELRAVWPTWSKTRKTRGFCGMKVWWKSPKASSCDRLVRCPAGAKLVASNASNLLITIHPEVPLCVCQACIGSRSCCLEGGVLQPWQGCAWWTTRGALATWGRQAQTALRDRVPAEMGTPSASYRGIRVWQAVPGWEHVSSGSCASSWRSA
jgi:hypothetical protein